MIMHCLTNNLPVFDGMYKKCLNFIDTCLHHHNDIVRFVLLGMVLNALRVYNLLVEI